LIQRPQEKARLTQPHLLGNLNLGEIAEELEANDPPLSLGKLVE
jgi:hypothetical protein